MNDLQRRLKEVVDTRYGGVASKASLAAGLNDNAVLKILRNPNHQSTLETLDRMAQTYGWSLCDVVYWRLGRTPPDRAPDPPQAVAQILASANYREGDREFITELVARCAPNAARSEHIGYSDIERDADASASQ